ncbi:MAG: ATP-binding cassette domain-containing protein [Anaerolineales bacterium]|nr:ATP-binding cassette domain-containing protein [Anaerolineales bacterium]
MPPETPPDPTSVLEVEGVTKRFPGVLANDNVGLKLQRGEILALLGENGAGKSTLMNIIYGLYHADSGTIRLKGRETRFASPREAIHSGIGMVHQHFQLVNVMTVAENVVLGEESTVAYKGENSPVLRQVLGRLPSLVLFALGLIIGFALGGIGYILGGAVAGLVAGVVVALPPVARLLWGIVWRVGLALAALAIASQVEMITQVGITDVALRQKVEMVRERKPVEMDGGYTVKSALVRRERIAFDWAKEYRTAKNTRGVVTSAKAQLEEYRGKGVPGWLLEAIDDVPPVAQALSVVLLLIATGWHSITSWRGTARAPSRPKPADLALVGALLVFYVAAAWLNLDMVSTAAQVGLVAALILALAAIARRAYQRRQHAPQDGIAKPSPLDGILDSFLVALRDVTEIGNARAAAKRVRELSRQYGLEVDPDAPIEKLPVGMQQRVEIIKALYRHADILILDEPTAVLTPQESRELFKIMRELASQGVSIIFITHKLKEVFEVATNIVVMRDGRVVGTTTPAQATESLLAEMMVGREVILQVEKSEAQPAEPVLEVERLSAIDDRGAEALRGVSFAVHAGEVLGLAGVQGNGQTELVEVLTGLRELAGGSVHLLGKALQSERQPAGSPGARIAAFALDMLTVVAASYFAAYFTAYFRNEDMSIGLVAPVALIVDALYFLGSWLAKSRSLGMALVGLELADQHDRRPGPLQLIQRYVAFVVLRLPLFVPLLVMAWAAQRDADRQTWLDRLLGLRLIRRERITPRRIKDAGTSHVPENRQRHGLVRLYSVADNLVLNDYYERPFAKEPNLAELPGALLRYLLIVGAVIALLTGIALYVWDEWLWSAVLDAYNVPHDLREIGASLSRAQKTVLQYPLNIGVIALLIAELAFGVIGHLVALRVLGAERVRAAISRAVTPFRQAIWQRRGGEGQVPAPQGGLLRDEEAILNHATDLIEEFDIRTPSPTINGGNLSGGNQQKLIVAREFSRRPRLLIAAQPTRGIDVGSIEFIHRQIIEQRDESAAVLLVSAELDEIMALSDRIAVLYKGEVIDTLPAKSATREQLGLLMAGIKSDGARAAAEPAPA